MNMKARFLTLLLLGFVVVFASCSDDDDDKDDAPTTTDSDSDSDSNSDSDSDSDNDTTDSTMVSFASAVQPILTTSCAPCHISASSGGYNFSNYDGVKAAVDANELLESIKHEDGVSPMPKNADKLSDALIATIETWINEGAKDN